MGESAEGDVKVGDLSSDGTHYWEGDLWQWQPLWLVHDEVIEAARRCYRFPANSVSFLSDGLLNQSWHLDTGSEAAVLRISLPGRTRDQLAYEHAVTATLTTHLPFVVAPLPGPNGATIQHWNGKLLSLFPFVAGTAGTNVAAEDRCREAARTLAEIHRASLDQLPTRQRTGCMPADAHSGWTWPRVRPLLARELAPTDERDELFAVFDRETARLDTWLAELHASRRPLARATIHGDYNPRNMIFHDRRIAAVIDWDNCRLDVIAYEVAAAALIRVDVSPTAFWRAYLDCGGPLSPDDVDLLGNFACIDVLAELQWAIHDNGRVVPIQAIDLLRDLAAQLERLHNDEAMLRSRP